MIILFNELEQVEPWLGSLLMGKLFSLLVNTKIKLLFKKFCKANWT